MHYDNDYNNDITEEVALPYTHPSVIAWDLQGPSNHLTERLDGRGLEGEELDTVVFFQRAVNLLKMVRDSKYLQSKNSYVQQLLGVELEQLNYYTKEINSLRTPLPLHIPSPHYVFFNCEGEEY